MSESVLLRAKLRPPAARADAVRRRRLVDALLEHSDRRLQLVISPAGFGKTTLLADFAAVAPDPVAWLTLDAGDRDPRSFVEHLALAVREHVPAAGGLTLAALTSAPEIEERATTLARTMATDLHEHVTGACLIVLDDFHLVNDSLPVTTFMDELLRLLPENVRIVLAGRTLPNLTVSRLVLDNNLAGLSDTDLRFTPDEVSALFKQRYGAELSPSDAADLTARAEGWIAGLLLSVHRLRDGRADDPTDISGARRRLYQYLADQAYDRQPPSLREFLLASSTLHVLTETTCSALLGPGDWLERLEEAESANLLVTRVSGSPIAFRYHQLFRGFLQARLRREQPEQFRALHVRAARNLVAEKDWPSAIDHYQEAGEHDECARLVARVAPELEREGRWYLLARTIDSLPVELRVENAPLLLSRARAAALTGDIKSAEVLARQAVEAGGAATLPAVHAWSLQVLGNALRRLGRTADAVEALESTRALAPDDDALVATVRRDLAGCHGVQGNFQAAAAEFGAAYQYFDRAGNSYEAARAAFGVGAALGRTGDVSRAISYYEEALRRWRDLGDGGNVALLLNNIGYLRSFQGDYAGATSLLEEGLAAARDAGHRLAEAQLLDSLGSILLGRGELSGATESYAESLAIAQDVGDLWAATAALEGAGFCALLRGDVEAATRAFEHGAALAERQHSPYRAAQMAACGAVARLQAGAAREAVAILTEAETTLAGLDAHRDLVRTRAWLAHALYRLGNRTAARERLHRAVQDATVLGIPALLDLPARWDPEAFAAVARGAHQPALRGVLERVRAPAPPSRLTATEPPPRTTFAAYSFGQARVVRSGGSEVEWPREKARELFFYLLHLGPTRTPRLLVDLWPESEEAAAKATLYSSAYALRRSLHPDALRAENRSYALTAEAVEYHDAADFDRLHAQIATEADPARRIEIMEQLIALYTGPLLDDVEGEWVEPLRRSYEARYLDTLESLVTVLAARKDWRSCAAAANRGLLVDPDSRLFVEHAAMAYRAMGKPWTAARIMRGLRARQTTQGDEQG